MRDRAAINLTLATAATRRQRLRDPQCSSDPVENQIASKYYSRCISQLCGRLDDRLDQLSDGVIVTMLGLACSDVSLFTDTRQPFSPLE
jgi:hypothetical protein